MESFLIIYVVLGMFLFICLIVAAAMALLFFIFSHKSGWTVLARSYAATSEPVQTVYTKQTIKVGGVRWRFATTVGISSAGLYLSVHPLRWPLSRFVQHPPLLIPWKDIKVVGPGYIYLLMPSTELSIGNPEIASLTVTNNVYEAIAPHLDGAKI